MGRVPRRNERALEPEPRRRRPKKKQDGEKRSGVSARLRILRRRAEAD